MTIPLKSSQRQLLDLQGVRLPAVADLMRFTERWPFFEQKTGASIENSS
jgi:hypothetical protein